MPEINRGPSDDVENWQIKPEEERKKKRPSKLSSGLKKVARVAALAAAAFGSYEAVTHKDDISHVVGEAKAKAGRMAKERREIQHGTGVIVEKVYKSSGDSLNPVPGTINAFDVIYPEFFGLKIMVGDKGIGIAEVTRWEYNQYTKGQQVEVDYLRGLYSPHDGTNLRIRLSKPSTETGK